MAFPFLASLGTLVALCVGLPYTKDIQLEYINDQIQQRNLTQTEPFGKYISEDNMDKEIWAIIVLEIFVASFLLFLLMFGSVSDKITRDLLEERDIDGRFKEHFKIDEIPNKNSGGLVDPLMPAFMCLTIIVMLGTITINMIPIIGTILWIFANGWVRAWDMLHNLLPMIGYKGCCSQIRHLLCHPVSYIFFGAVVFAISIVPIVGVLFTGGNACALALLFEGFVSEGPKGPDEDWEELQEQAKAAAVEQAPLAAEKTPLAAAEAEHKRPSAAPDQHIVGGIQVQAGASAAPVALSKGSRAFVGRMVNLYQTDETVQAVKQDPKGAAKRAKQDPRLALGHATDLGQRILNRGSD